MKKLFVGVAIIIAGFASAKGIVVSNSKIATAVNTNATLVNTLMQNEKILKLNNNILSQEQLKGVLEITVKQLQSIKAYFDFDCSGFGLGIEDALTASGLDPKISHLIGQIAVVIYEILTKP